MLELKVECTIPATQITSLKSPEEVEESIRNIMSSAISKKIEENIDELSFIEMEMSDDNREFICTGEFILSAQKDMETALQICIKRMESQDMHPDAIMHCLEPLLESSNGF